MMSIVVFCLWALMVFVLAVGVFALGGLYRESLATSVEFAMASGVAGAVLANILTSMLNLKDEK